jgi:hypothetical protein
MHTYTELLHSAYNHINKYVLYFDNTALICAENICKPQDQQPLGQSCLCYYHTDRKKGF